MAADEGPGPDPHGFGDRGHARVSPEISLTLDTRALLSGEDPIPWVPSPQPRSHATGARSPRGQLQNSVQTNPSSSSISRSSGRLIPTTLCGSPVTPETKAPPSPSRVKAPATPEGSPVATYASISSSETCANRTWVAADLASQTSRWVSITQCPVCSTPARPRICCQRSTASWSLL